MQMKNLYLERLKDIKPFDSNEACRQFGDTLEKLDIMQLNIGRQCNLSCKHCHIEAGDGRTEEMDIDVMLACLDVFEKNAFSTLDITGGAPEMNPNFRFLVEQAAARGIHTIVRTNLAIMEAPGYGDIPEFCAQNKVELFGSLPYYSEKDTDRQRGQGVFSACISALQRLNALGYGRDAGLVINLVYNPGGAFLPPGQESLAIEYRKKLSGQLGVEFNDLYAITNNPIGRFGDFLDKSGNLKGYMDRLTMAFNPLAAENMMCRSQISVDYDGIIYDCDFNLALGLKANIPCRIQELKDTPLTRRRIVFGNHCYACTAGAGSSCGGTTT